MEFMIKKNIVTVRMSHQSGNYVSPSANLTVTVWNVCVAMFRVNEQEMSTLDRKETRSLNHVACKSIANHSHNLDSAFTPSPIEKQSYATISKYNLSNSVTTRYSLIACFLSPPLLNSCEFYGFRLASIKEMNAVFGDSQQHHSTECSARRHVRASSSPPPGFDTGRVKLQYPFCH